MKDSYVRSFDNCQRVFPGQLTGKEDPGVSLGEGTESFPFRPVTTDDQRGIVRTTGAKSLNYGIQIVRSA